MKGVQTGTLESTTPEQEAVLEQLSREMADQLAELPQLRTKWSLLRFLRARQFNLKKAKLMLQNYLDFRKAHSHEAVAQMPIDKFKPIYDNYSSGYCWSDNEGNLVVVEQVAKSKPEAVLSQCSENDVIDFLIQRYERMMYVVMPTLSRIHNRRIERTCLIVDLKKVSSGLFFHKKVRDFLSICAKMGQDYYPETLERCFIINAPFVFKTVWTVIKLMLDERTVSKMFIETDGGLKVMAKYLDVTKLPPELGGTNTHPVDELNGPWAAELLDSYDRKSLRLKDRTPEYTYYWLPSELEQESVTEQRVSQKGSNRSAPPEGSSSIKFPPIPKLQSSRSVNRVMKVRTASFMVHMNE